MESSPPAAHPDAFSGSQPAGECTGWAARLELAFQRRGGTTVPTLRRHEGPLRTQRHREGGAPGQCEQLILHPPGGLVGGDTLSLETDVGPGADVLLTSPGCAKFYRSLGAEARQEVALRVAAGGALEWLPQPTLLFDGAIAALSFRLDVAPGGRALAWEIQSLGRRLGPQGPLPFLAGRLDATLEVRVGGALVLAERLAMAADDPWRLSPLGLGGAAALGTLVIVHAAGAPARDLLRAVPAPPGLRTGATSPAPGFTALRALGDCAETMFRHFSAVRDACRESVFGEPCAAPRIWFT